MTDKAPAILNLDSFVTEKVIKLKGKERKVRSMTVGDFINSKPHEEKMAAAGNMAAQIDIMVDRILEFVSDTKKPELLALTQDQLFAIFTFIRGDDVAEATGAATKNP